MARGTWFDQRTASGVGWVVLAPVAVEVGLSAPVLCLWASLGGGRGWVRLWLLAPVPCLRAGRCSLSASVMCFGSSLVGAGMYSLSAPVMCLSNPLSGDCPEGGDCGALSVFRRWVSSSVLLPWHHRWLVRSCELPRPSPCLRGWKVCRLPNLRASGLRRWRLGSWLAIRSGGKLGVCVCLIWDGYQSQSSFWSGPDRKVRFLGWSLPCLRVFYKGLCRLVLWNSCDSV